jgi:hypothetical protein
MRSRFVESVSRNEAVADEGVNVGCKRIAIFRQTTLLDRFVDPAQRQQQVRGKVIAR